MDVLIRHTPKGFLRVVGCSFALHVFVIVVGLALFKAGPRKVFFSPVYTVDLVDPAAVRSPQRTPEPLALAKEEAKAPVPEPPAPVKEEAKVAEPPAPAKKEAVKKAAPEALKTSQLAPEKAREVSIEESLKKIKENVRKEEDSRLLASRIEELKRKESAKSAELNKTIDEIKKGLAAAPPVPAASKAAPGPVAPSAGPVPGAGPRQVVTSANLEVKYPAYLSAIRDKVQANWIYPETFKSTKSAVIVSVKINRDGGLLDLWVEKSSGVARFDDSLVNAVRKAAPFPPLPADFEGAVFETGLRFCPECTE